MNDNIIDRSSWKIIEIIIRRYPDSKEAYQRYIDDVLASSQAAGEGIVLCDEYITIQSITEAKALKMTSKYVERLKKETEAIEAVYSSLRPEEQEVMETRFWSDKRKNIPYTKIQGICYSERQMRRIVKKIITRVGKNLGEIL